jgi:hypothetical protein
LQSVSMTGASNNGFSENFNLTTREAGSEVLIDSGTDVIFGPRALVR